MMPATHGLIDILWLLNCTALVVLMQAGFSCLESGLVRSKNSINVAIKNFIDFCVSSAMFWAFGIALMFGASRYPLDYGRERPVDYRLVNCPYGEDLMGRGIQLSMNATFTENDLGDIIQGIRKVADYYRL